ncbi:disease resistance RPP13-like protein 4 [Oryza brachyantha]|uniref:Disease resistance R13L4/SHOC-2-like LRR domain-containing protein n=1 Tax=Oryza brachyantha TaxID=4533 RepID=J3N9T6_ORYBR|nr:disease resistance RPP13-like protein 4 [Oryza brachyantha]
MAAPGPGGGQGLFSKYIDDNILTPLLASLQVIGDDERFRGAESSASASMFLHELDSIRDLMNGLQALLVKTEENERLLVHLFDPIEELVDSVLKSLAAGGKVATLHPKLAAIRAQIGIIREAILGCYKIQATKHGGHGREYLGSAPTTVGLRRTVCDDEQMAHLRRAVLGMDTQLRRCLLCLTAFPEGAVVKKRLLIHWWVGEEFVTSFDAGKKHFQQLVDLRFVRAVRRGHCDTAHACTLHPWIRKMLVAVARSSAFLEVDPDGNGCSSNDFTRTRRACLHNGELLPASRFHPEVSTVYNVGQNYVKLSTTWFSNKPQLSTVQLGQWRTPDPVKQIADPRKSHVELIADEHLKGIGACRNLRYLSLRGMSRIMAIPAAIGELAELVVLDLRACHDLQVLAKEITKLQKLQYLDVSECYLLVDMPEGFGKMSQLRVLKGFVVANSSRKRNSCNLSELASLSNLCKLSISVGKKLKRAEDDLRVLANFDSLTSLKITWGMMSSRDGADESNAAKVKLVLPSSLSKLDLYCFPSGEFEMTSSDRSTVLPRLKKLYFTGEKLQSLRIQKGKCKVEVLRVRCLKYLQVQWEELHELYPELKFVQAQHCPGVANWPLDNSRVWRKEGETSNAASAESEQPGAPDVSPEIVEEE